jgi:BirA family biotin operon repressor/biotin-[acetyl-CoA-carboxylase] ligase
LLAGIALHDALTPYTRNLMLKWPNDLLLDGAKLAGILVDATFDATGTPAWFVIGIGANLAHAPEIPGRQTASLPAPAPSPRIIAEAILTALDTTQNITTEWLKRAHPPGTQLSIQTPQRTIEGTFETITGTGALKLHQHAEAISSGEVLLGFCPRPRWGLGVYAEAIPPNPQHSLEAAPCFS